MTATLTRTFAHESLDGSGKRIKGKIEATTSQGAATALSAQGMTPLFIGETGTGLQSDIKIPGLGGKTSLKDLAIWTRQFATMTSSGMSLLRSLAILEEQTEKPSLKAAVREIYTDINAGLSLSGAMAKQEKIFPASWSR